MARIRRLWLNDYRNYIELDLVFAAPRVVLSGDNGQGKSNILEAMAYLGSLASFRGAPPDALIRFGTDSAVIRAEVISGQRELLIEAELRRGRANRVLVNKQRLPRARELVGLMPVTVFGPDDLDLVKAGPSLRRKYLDDLLVQLHPRNNRTRSELEKILKQRNALLRSARGSMSGDVASTLAVWNSKLAEVGELWGRARQNLVTRLAPRVHEAYRSLAGEGHPVGLTYAPPWLEAGLLGQLEQCAKDELRRGTTLIGPHRDELDLTISQMPARTHASQGEQRTLALAMRIAGHHELADVVGTSPVLLLDDVFSELDASRAGALLGLLVADQTLMTTTDGAPAINGELQSLVVSAGTVSPSPGPLG